MSEDKVRRKDWCWSVRAVYVLEKLSDVSGPGLEEARRYRTQVLIPSGCVYNDVQESMEKPSHLLEGSTEI